LFQKFSFLINGRIDRYHTAKNKKIFLALSQGKEYFLTAACKEE